MASPVDPPIYSALLRYWRGSGRTVPGYRDQEWNQAAALPAWSDRSSAGVGHPLRVSGSPDPRGDGR
ncbi:hypothetical protein DDV98_18905 [Streptomyces sp. IB2014 011-12]|nr:hypothetical protein STIB_69400 [Streptomyces sp. IB2014 011-1]RDV50303.1 hypothetical protein DDV98_18905 [Streptomyces sp. IB2014 011-12]